MFAALLAALAAAAPNPAADPLVHAYAELCLAGNPDPGEILGRADRAGWHKAGIGQPSAFDPQTDRFLVTPAGTLRLSVQQKVFKDEELRACAIDSTAADPNVIEAVASLLGVPAALSAPNVADFFAIRDSSGWRDGAGLHAPEVAKYRAAGNYFSFIVSRSPNSAAINGLHFAPLAKG